MHVYFVNRFYWPDESATAQILRDLAEHLVQKGLAVTVLSSRQLLECPDARLPAAERHEGVSIVRIASTNFGRRRRLALRSIDFLSFYFSLFFTLCARLRRGDVVVALTDPPLVSVVAALACVVRRARLINWLQDFYPEVAWRLNVISEASLVGRGLRRMRNWTLRRAVQNIAIGEHMAHCIRNAGAPVKIIHNWSRDLQYSPQPKAENAYRQLVGCGESLLLCYSGNLGRAHRFEALLRASEHTQHDHRHHVLIIGGGHQFGLIQQRAAEQRLANWTFLPYQSRGQLDESLGAADVHIVSLDPSLEGLIVPSKFYGVLAAGRACIFIGHPEGEVANLLHQHDCGWVVSPDDADGLANLLRQLVSERELLVQKGRNARRAFEQTYAPQLALRRWQAVIESVIS